MRFPFKRYLILLMMLVLPVQTFASAAMLGCAFSHQGSGSAAKMAQMDHTEAMPPCHVPDAPPAPEQHDCTHCAACYMASAMALPTMFVPPVTALTHGSLPSFAPSSFIGFIPDSPERPPRTTSL